MGLTISRTQETTRPESFDKGIITLPEEVWEDALQNFVFSSKILELATCPGLILWIDMSSCGTNGNFGTALPLNVSIDSNLYL